MTIFFDAKRRYGTPKIHQVLLSMGWHVSLKRVQRRMVILGIHSVVIKKYRHFSDNHPVPEKENILKQDFTATAINQKWCTDITYIHTQDESWTYLASVMNFYSKKIIGWAYGTSMTAELAIIKAVENACLNVSNTTGIILHSDLGSQYTSKSFERYLAKKKIHHSFSRKGCPYDNACIESFHSVLKKEEIYRKAYKDSTAAYNSIEHIESWYNRKRIHSSLGYRTPEAVHAGGAA